MNADPNTLRRLPALATRAMGHQNRFSPLEQLQDICDLTGHRIPWPRDAYEDYRDTLERLRRHIPEIGIQRRNVYGQPIFEQRVLSGRQDGENVGGDGFVTIDYIWPDRTASNREYAISRVDLHTGWGDSMHILIGGTLHVAESTQFNRVSRTLRRVRHTPFTDHSLPYLLFINGETPRFWGAFEPKGAVMLSFYAPVRVFPRLFTPDGSNARNDNYLLQ